MSEHSEVQVSYDLAREDSDLTAVSVVRVFENGFKVLLQLQGDDAVAFIDAWNGRPAQQTRNEIIEECAKACEGRIKGTDGLPGGNEYGHYAPYNCEDLACAKAVRSLSAVTSTECGEK